MINRNFDDDFDDDEPYGFYEARCTACELYSQVNDFMLCEECNEKLERDWMRRRNWEYSATAFGLTIEGREEVRSLIIAQYGEPLELLDPVSEHKKNRKGSKDSQN